MSGRRINTGLTPTSSFNAGSRRDDIGSNISTLGTAISNAALSNRSLAGGANNNNNNNNRRNTNTNTSRNNSNSRNQPKDAKDFNPRLIFSQIVALQCFHYVFLGLLFQINYLLFGCNITIDRIFTDQYIEMWSKKGLPDAFAVLFSSMVGYVPFIFSLLLGFGIWFVVCFL